jgi:SAM-dependent methyltransferase
MAVNRTNNGCQHLSEIGCNVSTREEHTLTSPDQYATSSNLDARIRLHRKYTPDGNDMLDVIWNHYDFADGQSVLEVGCGSGAFWRHNKAKTTDINLLLTDASEGMLDAAKDNLAGSGFTPAYEVARAESLQFGDSQFDAVLAHFMLYHVSDKVRAIQELCRVSRGWVGIVLLGANSMGRIFDVLGQIDPDIAPPVSDADLFTASMAREPIEATFSNVQAIDYMHTMKVTDAHDILLYAQSSERSAALGTDFWAQYHQHVKAEIAQLGYFEVTKCCTLFICR